MDFGSEDSSHVWVNQLNNVELLPLEVMHSLSSEFHNHNVEMDHFLHLQSNILRRSIMEEETRRRAMTMQRCEARATALLLQKEGEIAAARDRARELQRFLRAAETEATAWERAAREREAAAAELRSRLDQATRQDEFWSSSSSSSSSPKRKRNICCRVCGGGESFVVLFPCRHICCCTSCEPLLERCPLCQALKEATLQVSFN